MNDPQAESRTVEALRTLSIFGADQAGAYREHYANVAMVLGPDLDTRMCTRVADWAAAGRPGLRILTGNAGTGKTAAAERFCAVAGMPLPSNDGLCRVGDGRWVIKDLSGIPNVELRSRDLQEALAHAPTGQVLICANEGVLRDTVRAIGADAQPVAALLDSALRVGAATHNGITVINVNRQRLTGETVWAQLVNHVARAELWDGCEGCPFNEGGCPMRWNAAYLRDPHVSEGLRTLVRLASGQAVPTLRELLAILSWAMVGGWTCSDVKRKFRDRGREDFHAQQAYFAWGLGAGLEQEVVERSPVLVGMLAGGLGDIADLQVDDWLRDSTDAPSEIQTLAATPPEEERLEAGPDLSTAVSPASRVQTSVGTMSFYRLGEMVAVSEDLAKVNAGIEALVGPPPGKARLSGNLPAQVLWRRRVFFEGPEVLGGQEAAVARLLSFRFFRELTDLAADLAAGRQPLFALAEIVKGLNFLVTGFASASEGLLVPDPSCLFARDPGSFRPASPSLVRTPIDRDQLLLSVPDRGLVTEELDVDHIEVTLTAKTIPDAVLRISPRMYEAIREAALFQGPVGHSGLAEMTDLRDFYGRLASHVPPQRRLRVADPNAQPPSLVAADLPAVPVTRRPPGAGSSGAGVVTPALSPNAIAEKLFGIIPDRDERAPQLAAETLLTLSANGYALPAAGALQSPKREQFALRSLVLRENFLAGRHTPVVGGMSADDYGRELREGNDFGGSAYLGLLRRVFEGLIDPATQRGQSTQRGSWLLRPFHEQLLWYDARAVRRGGSWGVRKVYMRGSGITLAHLLLDAPSGGPWKESGLAAVAAIADSLRGDSPLADVAKTLESPVLSLYTPARVEVEEQEAWDRAAKQAKLRPLAERLCAHAEGIMLQKGASGPARLWQLRTMLALDLACHILRSSWDAVAAAAAQRYLLLTFGGPPRATNRVRQQSESSYQQARIVLSEATRSTVAAEMRRLAQHGAGTVDWRSMFGIRENLAASGPNRDFADTLRTIRRDEEFDSRAGAALQRFNYERASRDAFRVLIASAGMLAGTGQYQFLTAPPDLLAAMVGALSNEMPMESDQFFRRCFEEWSVVLSGAVAETTTLYTALDGAELTRNGHHSEQVMVEAGLALALSDRTTVVGERAARRV